MKLAPAQFGDFLYSLIHSPSKICQVMRSFSTKLSVLFQSLTSPRKLLLSSNRLSPRSAASTPKRSPATNRKSKLATPVIGTPGEKPKQPNGLIRRDSFHDIGSDSEMDEPFFNFDSEEMDDEELYSESLLEELKKQQVC